MKTIKYKLTKVSIHCAQYLTVKL